MNTSSSRKKQGNWDVEMKIAKIINKEGIRCDLYGRKDSVILQKPTAKKILNLLKKLGLLREVQGGEDKCT